MGPMPFNYNKHAADSNNLDYKKRLSLSVHNLELGKHKLSVKVEKGKKKKLLVTVNLRNLFFCWKMHFNSLDDKWRR